MKGSWMTDTTERYGEITNVCECDGDYCGGDCWDLALDCFAEDIRQWWDDNPTYLWRVEGLPLWDRTVSGQFEARTIEDFVRGITVRSEWRLRWSNKGDHLECVLSHHDVPTGGVLRVYHGIDDGDF